MVSMPTRGESTPNPSLPDDLLWSCIARVSRSYYPTLSLVCKSFRSFIASGEIYKTRSLLGHTESCLYVCLGYPTPRWFTLYCIPDRTRKNSSGNILVPIPSPFPQVSSSLVAVGSSIYKIGGDVYSSAMVSVLVLDCKSHTWHQAPRMREYRYNSSTASLVDGKIYVAGGCEDRSSVNWFEDFDPKTQTWSSLPSPSAKILDDYGSLGSVGFEGKFYLFGSHRDPPVAYNPEEGRWNLLGFSGFAYCVIGNIFFGLNSRDTELHWLDPKGRYWSRLRGVEDVCISCPVDRCKVAESGGNMVVLWDECDGDQENMIWCAEISFERRVGDEIEIWGKVEWCDVVLRLPKSRDSLVVDAVSAIV